MSLTDQASNYMAADDIKDAAIQLYFLIIISFPAVSILVDRTQFKIVSSGKQVVCLWSIFSTKKFALKGRFFIIQ